MKKMGRKHRPFFRVCVVDSRHPRDGRVLEELGTYDPMISETDARALLRSERIAYWLGVGAQPSDKVKVLIKKYGAQGTHLDQQRTARERLSLPKVVPAAGEPVYIVPVPGEAAAEAPAQTEAAAPAADSSAAGDSEEQAASAAE
jgi:small subunit ribosomal protein S16